MYKRFLVLAALGASLCTTAYAQTANDKLSWNVDGTLSIASVVHAANGCYSAGTATTGTPVGERPIQQAVSIIYPLKHNGQPACTMAIKPVKFAVTVKVPAGTQALVVYTTDTHLKSVQARALALPPKPSLAQ